ncbi:MAG: ribosome maturation factor RimM [Candidatus Binatia bacterium]
MSERLVPLGEIVTTHGLDGWLKCNPYNPKTTLLFPSQKIFLEKSGECSLQLLEMSRAYKRHFLVKLQGINGINEAQRWIGSVLSVAEERLQPLKPGEYYYYQVIGLDVFDTQGKWIGMLTRIWSKEGGDLYVVTGTSKEYLIPAAKEIVEKVDLPEGKMIINPPPGLLEL